jgi:UDPglucose 6-dehydrogenase
LIKYFKNSFLAAKVSLMNEFRITCNSLGADWYSVVRGMLYDHRIGESHTQVPGPDGKFGWGGKCFPKDVSALLSMGPDMPILAAVDVENKKHREI